jgi:hypothetical protein
MSRAGSRSSRTEPLIPGGTSAATSDSKDTRHPGRWQYIHELNKLLKILVFSIAIGNAAAVSAQQYANNLSVDLDSRTLSVQAKAEELFQREDYRRAHVIYRNDLAPIGDKYAQYMLGFMSLSGLGVEQDPVLASAWYRLAAERGEPEEFVAIRDELLDQLDAVDRARSNEIYLGLCRDYSDIAISMREAREAFEDLSQITTGSRLGGPSSAVTIVEPRAGNSLSGDALIYRLERRMQGHLDHITETLGRDRIEAGTVTPGKLSELEEQVQDYIRRPDAR